MGGFESLKMQGQGLDKEIRGVISFLIKSLSQLQLGHVGFREVP